MAHILVYVVIAIASGITLIFLDAMSTPFNVVSGLLVGLAIPIIDSVVVNRRHIRMAWYSIRYAWTTVRISAAYLYRIKVDDKYLLVRGNRYLQYQPVGGVWKLTSSADGFMREIRAKNDELIPIDEVSKQDIRLRIPGIYVHKFVRWFEGGKGREVAPWREFYEELIVPGLLPAKEFPHVMHEYVERTYRPIRYSKYAQSYELLVADIYELLPNDGQLAALRELHSNHGAAFAWVTEGQIRRRGAVPGKAMEIVIGEPAEWIL